MLLYLQIETLNFRVEKAKKVKNSSSDKKSKIKEEKRSSSGKRKFDDQDEDFKVCSTLY